MRAVADSGPLIHLHEISRLSLLRVFEELHIPDAVWEETVLSGRLTAQELAALPVRRHHLPELDFSRPGQGSGGLHRGEAEAISLCGSLGVELLLTDDMVVRRAARAYGLRPIGSLGIVVRAHRAGLLSLSDAIGGLNELQSRSSLYVTRAIVDLAVEELRQWQDERGAATDEPQGGHDV